MVRTCRGASEGRWCVWICVGLAISGVQGGDCEGAACTCKGKTVRTCLLCGMVPLESRLATATW